MVLRLRGDASAAQPPAERLTRDELAEASRLRQRRVAFGEFQTLWREPPVLEVLSGAPDQQAVPVVICLWNRPGQIDELLARLDGQRARDGGKRPRLRVLLWNNCAADDAWYRERIAAFAPQGAVSSIEYVASPHNIRGVARFIAARALWEQGVRGAFLMLDDDELIGTHALSDLLEVAGPRRIVGVWSWRVNPDDYWQRERALDGEEADYVATCGCACDLEIVADDEFFTELSELGLFIEDAWMSRLALSRGWELRGRDIEVEFVLHETNQYGPLIWDKVAFWSSLNERYPLPKAAERRSIRNN